MQRLAHLARLRRHAAETCLFHPGVSRWASSHQHHDPGVASARSHDQPGVQSASVARFVKRSKAGGSVRARLDGSAPRRKNGFDGAVTRAQLAAALLRQLAHFGSIEKGNVAADTLRALGLLRTSSSSPSSAQGGHLQALLKRFAQHIQSRMDRIGLLRDYSPVRTCPPSAEFATLPSIPDPAELERWLLAEFIPWVASQSDLQSGASSSSDPAMYAAFDHVARLTDMRRPQEQFREARLLKRRIHLHVGPTNSGKTHAALRALHAAHNGVYAGPLRLLAHEVCHRFNNGRIAADLPPRTCNLVTGEEQRIYDPLAGLTTCTVEMLSPRFFYDVCVIDEIQMIGDPERGPAWTDALLGAQALELHLCGEESVVGLIESIAKLCGDEVQVHRYQRLSPLRVADQSIEGDLGRVQKGDCIVTFSRDSIYAIKEIIEEKTGLNVGIAYGGLPPEIRERQAHLFNQRNLDVNGEGYDVLVGSDALGMGLNLKIKRIIFEALHKFNGRTERQLSPSQVKQIGGRAGRYSTGTSESAVAPDMEAPSSAGESLPGEVLTLHEADMGQLRKCMESPFTPISRAVLKAPVTTIAGLAELVSSGVRTPTLFGLRRALTVTAPIFAIGDEVTSIKLSEALERVQGLSLEDRLVFVSCPAAERDPRVISSLQQWASAHATGRDADLESWLRFHTGSDDLDTSKQPSSASDGSRRAGPIDSSEAVLRLESIHRCLVLYMWLGVRLPQTFVNTDLCLEWKDKVENTLMVRLRSKADAIKQDLGRPSVSAQSQKGSAQTPASIDTAGRWQGRGTRAVAA